METYMTVTFLAAVAFLLYCAISIINAIIQNVSDRGNDELLELRSQNVELREEVEDLQKENRLMKKKLEHTIFFPNEYAVERKNKTTPICYGERKEEENERNDGGVKNSGGMESDLQNRNRENNSIPGRGIYPSDGDRTDE